MEEPGRLQSTGSQRVRHDWATSFIHSIFRHRMERYFKSGKRSESVSQHTCSQRRKVVLFVSWYLQTQGPDTEWPGCLSLDEEELRREGATPWEGDKGQMSLIHLSPSSHPPSQSLYRALQRSRPTLLGCHHQAGRDMCQVVCYCNKMLYTA